MTKDTYTVCGVGESWSVTLHGQVTGTFPRRTDALVAAVICAGASAKLGHDAEVLTQGPSGETLLLWTNQHHVKNRIGLDGQRHNAPPTTPVATPSDTVWQIKS
jgi:hypothetical protein